MFGVSANRLRNGEFKSTLRQMHRWRNRIVIPFFVSVPVLQMRSVRFALVKTDRATGEWRNSGAKRPRAGNDSRLDT